MSEKKIHSTSDFWCIESKFFVMYSSLDLEGVWGGHGPCVGVGVDGSVGVDVVGVSHWHRIN